MLSPTVFLFFSPSQLISSRPPTADRSPSAAAGARRRPLAARRCLLTACRRRLRPPPVRARPDALGGGICVYICMWVTETRRAKRPDMRVVQKSYDASRPPTCYGLMTPRVIAGGRKTLCRFWTTGLLWDNGPPCNCGWSKNPMPLLDHRAMTRSGPEAS